MPRHKITYASLSSQNLNPFSFKMRDVYQNLNSSTLHQNRYCSSDISKEGSIKDSKLSKNMQKILQILSPPSVYDDHFMMSHQSPRFSQKIAPKKILGLRVTKSYLSFYPLEIEHLRMSILPYTLSQL